MSKESGRTCMNAVPRIMPAAKALTMMKRSRSGWRAGKARENSGEQTPIMLVTNIDTIAIIFSDRAFDLSMHEPVSDPHSSGATETAGWMRTERVMKKMINSLGEEDIGWSTNGK